jgi:Thioesterase-like superfamily
MATILRAMTAELAAADLAPRSVTAHFPRPLIRDLVEIQVETLRRGQRLATVQAHALQQGGLRCTVLAAFGRPFPAVATWEAEPPAAPPPAESAEVDLSTGPASPHGQHLRFRPVFGPPPLLGGDQALAGGWLELRESRPVDALAVCLFADAWWPAAWGRLRELVITPTVELTVRFRRGWASSPPDLSWLGSLPASPARVTGMRTASFGRATATSSPSPVSSPFSGRSLETERHPSHAGPRWAAARSASDRCRGRRGPKVRQGRGRADGSIARSAPPGAAAPLPRGRQSQCVDVSSGAQVATA